MKYSISFFVLLCTQIPSSYAQVAKDLSIQSTYVSQGSVDYSVGEIYVIELLGEEENDLEFLEVAAVPNPVVDGTVLMGSNELEGKKIHLTDISGRFLDEILLTGAYLHLPPLSSGIYFIVSPTNEFHSIRIIKK